METESDIKTVTIFGGNINHIYPISWGSYGRCDFDSIHNYNVDVHTV